MDLYELAMNPRKARQRMSPFSNELSAGQTRKLEYYFGDRATDDKAETVLYSRDASQPPGTLNLLLKRNAWAVARPQVRGELLELIEFAKQNSVPIVPRGAGTSGYGGSVPTEGGVVVDLRAFNKILKIDKAAKLVTVEANATFAMVEKAIRPHGLTLRQYPTSFHAATLAGWLSQGGGGVGSLKYGPFVNDVAEVTLLAPDGTIRVLKSGDLELVDGTFGTAGFIVEMKLRVREAKKEAHFLATFDDAKLAQQATRRVQMETKAYNLVYFTPEYAQLVNKAATTKLLPEKHGILVTLESADEPLNVELIKGIVLTASGSMAKEADAQKAWDNRFNHLNLKRLGPSVVVAEAAISPQKLPEAMEAAWKAHKMDRACIWAIAISPSELDIIFYGLDDERRATYPLAMGNALAVIDAVKGVGGRSYSTGVLAANESSHVLDGGARTMAQKAIEPERGMTITIGAILGAILVFAPMALISTFLLDSQLGGSIVQAIAGFWRAITTPLGGGYLSALVQSVVVGTIVGLVLFGGLVVTAFQRGERFLNSFLAIGLGGTVFVLAHLFGLLGAIGFGLALLVALLAGGLGTMWVLPLAIAQVFTLKHTRRMHNLQTHRRKTDPKEVFNPGPVLGARTRIMPLPVHDWNLQMMMASPMLKVQRGMIPQAPDPQFTAMQRALGRVHAGNLGEVAQEVTTCIFCGICNGVSPEGQLAPWESATPRGRVQLAKAVIEGRATLSPRVHRNVAWTSLEHAADAACPVFIPIQRTTDYLLGACVDLHGPLPEQAALVESYKANGNAYGKPADARSKWVTIGFDAVSTSAFVADDVAAYEAPEVAQAAALALANAGYPVAHMGKADAGSGATMFETGNRAVAQEKLVPFLEALAKKGITTVVTPDANGWRAMTLDWPLVGRANELEVPAALHTSTVLAELVKAKKIDFGDSKLAKKVVVHAPEGLTAAQRAAVMDVAKATGATIVPCEHHECGQGRALKALDEELYMRMAEGCLRAALDAGAEALITMSPGCYSTLKGAAKKAKLQLEVLDLHQVVASTMVSTGGAVAAAPIAASAEPSKPAEPEIPPDHFRVEFVKEGVVLAVHKNQNLLAAGADAGLELPSSCKAGSCDTCSARWEGTTPDQSAGSALSPDQQKTFVLTCIARPKGPIRLWSDERPK